MLTILVIILSVVLMVGGLILIVLNLPGIWLVWFGVLISAWVTDFEKIPFWGVLVIFLLSLFSTLLDNIAIIWGANRFGASKWGMIGAFVGAIIGMLVGSLFGLILGPFLGALIFEAIIAKKESKEAFRAGVGAALGFFLGIALKFGFAVGIVVVWLFLMLR